jgi:hypothetical protein
MPAGQILLDTPVVLAYLNASEAASPAAAVVIDDFVRTGRNRATISAVSVADQVRAQASGQRWGSGRPFTGATAMFASASSSRTEDRTRSVTWRAISRFWGVS